MTRRTIFKKNTVHIRRIIIAPYSAEDMFALVDDIDSYPQFLPWCERVEVSRDGETVRARLHIAYHGITTAFATRNQHRAGEHIKMVLEDGPLSALSGQWQFVPLADNRCRITLDLNYDFSNRLFSNIFKRLFGYIFNRFADNFMTRAKDIYGDAGRNKIAVEVARPPAAPQRLLLPVGATVADALAAAGITDTDAAKQVGIFGRLCAPTTPLTAGDRVEIYHPLPNDPRTARRARAKA